MKYLLDTNVVSELVAKRPNPSVVRFVNSIDAHAAFISVITIGEIGKGIEKLPESDRKTALRDWLRSELLIRFDQRILGIDTNVMLRWAEMIAKSEQAGQPMGAMDSLVAAVAVASDCAIVTRNESHFAHLPVSVVNPWS